MSPAVPVRIVDRDTGYAAFVKQLAEIGKTGVTVGVHADDGANVHDGPSIAEVAAIHEFGLGVPERSMVRGFVDEHGDEVRAWQRLAAQAVLERRLDALQALEQLGEKILGAMKERILAGIPPELAESTKKSRGDDAVALVHTAQMLGAFAYKLAEQR